MYRSLLPTCETNIHQQSLTCVSISSALLKTVPLALGKPSPADIISPSFKNISWLPTWRKLALLIRPHTLYCIVDAVKCEPRRELSTPAPKNKATRRHQFDGDFGCSPPCHLYPTGLRYSVYKYKHSAPRRFWCAFAAFCCAGMHLSVFKVNLECNTRCSLLLLAADTVRMMVCRLILCFFFANWMRGDIRRFGPYRGS